MFEDGLGLRKPEGFPLSGGEIYLLNSSHPTDEEKVNKWYTAVHQ